jgi:L-cysteate sulfo-lyase
MAGLIDMVRTGQIPKDETVVFIHTGGTPALFAYAHCW